MGTFVFKWEHPASEVFVTGTFDGWSKSEQLEKIGDIFEKNVTLSKVDEKIYYKFVVDGNWVTDHTAPQEEDPSGNVNNLLTPDSITKHTPATAGIMSGVTPTSTTAELAKDVPLENAPAAETVAADLPGAFPETPALETGEFSVQPIPEPGHTLTSGVRDDPELVAIDQAKEAELQQTVSVAPLPAFPGAVNPIELAPGEKIPEPDTLTSNSIHNNVTLDKESYETSGGVGNAPVLPPVVTPQAERDEHGTGVLDIPPVSENLIPESSLPMESSGEGTFDATPTIQSAGPESTTAQLAAEVPLETPKVPEIVKESQEEAGVSPEASAVPEEVEEKNAVEQELLKEVPEAPPTSEGTAGKGTDKSENGVAIGDGAAAVDVPAVALGDATEVSAADVASEVPEESVAPELPETVENSATTVDAESTKPPPAEDTSEVVKESITESSQTPEVVQESVAEAAQSPEVVTESTAEAAESPEVVTESTAETSETPEVAKESAVEPAQSAEAAASEEAVIEKKEVEEESSKEVKPETTTVDPAPKIAETKTDTPTATSQASTPAVPSRDVSPGTLPGSHSQASAISTPLKDANSEAATPASSKAADSPAEKKKKRTSIFGRLRAKFSDKK